MISDRGLGFRNRAEYGRFSGLEFAAFIPGLWSSEKHFALGMSWIGERSSLEDMNKSARDRIWSIAARGRDAAKRAGILEPFESILLRVAPLLIPPPSREEKVFLSQEMALMVPPGYSAGRTLKVGMYERELTHLLRTILDEGMNFVDVGANVGYYTLLSSPLIGRSGRVYAFEPDPRNYRYLRRNVSMNHLDNVRTLERAVSSASGLAKFVVDPHRAEGYVSDQPSNLPSFGVQTVALDDFFRGEGWPSLDVVKMDIEGNENDALLGMRESSRRNSRMQLILEYSPKKMRRGGVNPGRLIRTLIDLEFRQAFVIERNMKAYRLADGLPQTQATYNLLVRR